MNVEEQLWSNEAPAVSSVTVAQYELGPGCRTGDHDRSRCPGCSRADLAKAQKDLEETERSMKVQAGAQPLGQPALAAPAKAEAVPVVDSTSPSGIILRAASDLAAAMDRCMKLSTRIAGLEASIEFAMKERDEAEAAKAVAQEVLKKLVVQ